MGRLEARPTQQSSGRSPATGQTSLTGTIEAIVFANAENGFTVAQLRPTEGGGETVRIVGHLGNVSQGTRLAVHGRWVTHSRYGTQFEVAGHELELPTSQAGIRRYLDSDLIKGIGPALAERVVDHFGEATLTVLDREPGRLEDVPGIGPQRAKRIADAWQGQRAIRDVMLFLRGYGISTAYAVRIFQKYGRDAISVLREDPYRLAGEVVGIGFKTADRIALKMGIAPAAPERIAAALQHALDEAADDGHVYLPRGELVEACAQLLDLDPAKHRTRLERALDRLVEGGHLVADPPSGDTTAASRIYLPDLYEAEVTLAERLRELVASPSSDPPSEEAEPSGADGARGPATAISPHAEDELTEEQRTAVRAALTRPVTILTGGPGTGKTTTVRGMLDAMEALGWTVQLAAPTGRAAQRLGEATGREAQTIHRLLGYQPPSTFAFHERCPLPVDAVIVDELSMVDLPLMHRLVAALPKEARLVLVGDVDQLPSVGAGRVLQDLMASGRFVVVELTRIFRQAGESDIVRNAHRVKSGHMPSIRPHGAAGTFSFLEEADPERATERIVELVAERLPSAYGLDPLLDIQVLAPMYRGECGVNRLNERLQEQLNPREGIRIGRAQRGLRVGDKLMQVRNNYDKGVFNGDTGTIADANESQQTLSVRYPERSGLVRYEAGELGQLTLAYATTIHKSQGSEYPVVVLPLLDYHYVMLQRTLLYTALTRAKERAVLVGSERALRTAVRNNRQQDRHSALASRLQGET